MLPNNIIWIDKRLVTAIHRRQLAEHGGLDGLREPSMLTSALARPQNLYAYQRANLDLPGLAASYAFGLARNHPFVDGNKRTAAVVCETFLELNGVKLTATDVEMYPLFYGLAAGTVDEDELARWIRVHLATP